MSPRMPKLLRGAAVALGSLALACLVLEGALRFVLFSDFARAHFGWKLRQAGLYAPVESGRELWKLRARLAGPAAARPHPVFDARVGWLSDAIDPRTLAHRDEPELAGRTPVLLFGDSYAQCVGPPEECWQGLLDRSPLGATHALLNYGVSGYGLDQIHLLMQLVLERRFEREPVVVVGILVDDDLDRSYLRLRSWPKPTFAVEDGALVLRPLEHADARAYLRDDPLEVRSYLWRLCVRQAGIVPKRTVLAWADEEDHVAVKRELAVRLVRAIEQDLDARGLEHFFVLYHGLRALSAPETYGWQEPLLLGELRALGIPFVSSRRYLRADEARTGSTHASHYLVSGPGVNHYTAASNEVVFQGLLDGLAGRFEPVQR
jgi:hypothetical protein